jgi:SAM-dependent methyltransferase
MDLFAEGLYFARHRVSCALVQGDLSSPPFGARFDLIGLFDVLEHLPDDTATLQALHRMIAPGGALILTVPAYRSLWSYFDEASNHYRRYEPVELKDKLTQTGYRVEFCTPYMLSIFPLVWLGRRLAWKAARLPVASDRTQSLFMRELRITPGVNRLLYWLLFLEAQLTGRRRHLPWRFSGSRCACAGAST